MTLLSAKQLHVLQHALGMDRLGRWKRGEQYRNHFVASKVDEVTCRELAAAGYMAESKVAAALTGGAPCFHATPAGIKAAQDQSPAPPKLTRSQRRYEEYLAEDGNMKFGEWLKVRRTREAAC